MYRIVLLVCLLSFPQMHHHTLPEQWTEQNKWTCETAHNTDHDSNTPPPLRLQRVTRPLTEGSELPSPGPALPFSICDNTWAQGDGERGDMTEEHGIGFVKKLHAWIWTSLSEAWDKFEGVFVSNFWRQSNTLYCLILNFVWLQKKSTSCMKEYLSGSIARPSGIWVKLKKCTQRGLISLR